MYPLSKQETIVTNTEKLRKTAPDVATAFRALREAADAAGPLDDRTRELIMLAGFASTRNQDAFRIHCNRAFHAGASLKEIEQLVFLLLGTSLGLAPAVEALEWAQDELQHQQSPTDGEARR